MALLGVATVGCGRSDAALQAELQTQLAADAGTAGANITATVTNHVAHITGQIENRGQQTRAVDIARAIKGITDIVPEMHLSDAALARAVHDAIAADPAVGKIPLTVDAHDGTVRLVSDQTNADERTKIMQIAKAVEGVSKVEDRMR